MALKDFVGGKIIFSFLYLRIYAFLTKYPFYSFYSLSVDDRVQHQNTRACGVRWTRKTGEVHFISAIIKKKITMIIITTISF